MRIRSAWPEGTGAAAAMGGSMFDNAEGKPTRLHQVLSEADFDRIEAAGSRPQGGNWIILDEGAAMLFPARTYGNWLEALGFPDLAQRARTELAETTGMGDTAIAMLESGRRSPASGSGTRD